MNRKDCENFGRPARNTGTMTLCALALLMLADGARAGQIRLWPTAVVVAESITLGDLAEMRAMASPEEEDSLRRIVVTEAPPAGGSRIIHHEMIRSVLSDSGINLAKITLAGSSQCEVRRPKAALPAATTTNHPPLVPSGTDIQSETPRPQPTGRTLRQAVQDFFDSELARYGGRPEILFDRSDDNVLELTAPPLEFVIHRDNGTPLGLVALEVGVLQSGKLSQDVRLIVRTALSRSVLTARRAINQGAAVTAADVELMPVTFTRLDDMGLDDAATVIGQRARRFIPAGTQIAMDAFEPMPLVLRGQLITLVSEVGGVRVVTTAKACANGIRGETIRVRSTDDNKVEFDAIVTGPGEARAAGSTPSSPHDSKPRLAAGGVP